MLVKVTKTSKYLIINNLILLLSFKCQNAPLSMNHWKSFKPFLWRVTLTRTSLGYFWCQWREEKAPNTKILIFSHIPCSLRIQYYSSTREKRTKHCFLSHTYNQLFSIISNSCLYTWNTWPSFRLKNVLPSRRKLSNFFGCSIHLDGWFYVRIQLVGFKENECQKHNINKRIKATLKNSFPRKPFQ